MDKEKNRLIGVAAIVVVIVAIVAAALVLTGDDDRGGDDEPEGVLFELTVSSNDGGSVSPAGTTKLAEGTTQTITITPDSGFIVSDVLLDGGSVGAVTSLKVEMDGNHAVEVVFIEETEPVPVEHTITASAGAGGRISPSGEVNVADGADQTFTFTANGSYRVSQVTVDGKTVTVTGNSYTFEDVTGDHTISVTFRYVGGGGGGTTPSVTLTRIDVTTQPERTSYMEGEEFNPTGMVVTASYSNGSAKEISGYTYSPNGQLAVTDTNITVTYQGKTVTVSITVISESSDVKGIEVTTPPTKTHYFDDQEFVQAGMEVSAVYEGNVKIPLSASEYTAVESNGIITITYNADNSKTAPFAVTRDNTITDLDELKHFRNNVNDGISYSGEMVKLGADFDLNNEEWIPIGYPVAEIVTLAGTNAGDPFFGGTFDGDNHKISNLTINLPDGTSVGLFGKIIEGSVTGLTIENANVQGKSEVGVIAGSYTVDISDCNITGLVQVEGKYKVGGIVGYIYGDVTGCTIAASEGSYVKGAYEMANFEGDNVGGAIGFTGEGSFTHSGIDVSGLAVEGTRKVGGVIGYLHHGVTVTNSSFTTGTVTSNAAEDYATSNKTFVGGIVGEFNGGSDNANSSITDCTVTDAVISGPNRDYLGEIYGGTRNSSDKLTASGNGSTGVTIIDPDTVRIGNVDELLDFASKVNSGQSLDSNVILTNDIDLTGVEWIPIGLNADGVNKFKGTFDGQNHTISNMNVQTETEYTAAGFFGALNGTVKNLIFDGATVKHISEPNTDGNTNNGIAVVAGSIYNTGTIENVTVKNATVEGNRYVGGIAGYVYGSITGCTVEGVELKATPDNLFNGYDNGDKVGGIAGYVGEGSYTLTGCSVSNTEITGYRNLGGIVGTSDKSPTGCTVENVTIIHDRSVIEDAPSLGNQSGIILGTRIFTGSVDASNKVQGTVTTDDVDVLEGAIGLSSGRLDVSLAGGIYAPHTDYSIDVASGKDVTIGPTDGAAVVFDGRFKVTGALEIRDITMNTSHEVTDEISQFKYTGVALMDTGSFTAKNVVFSITQTGGTAITAWWSTGEGTDITVESCTFDCNGNRPIRSDANVTVQSCTFKDPYRYAVQMTSKASTMTAENATVNFNSNSIVAGNTTSNPVYGVQLEGETYGCSNLIINGSGNTIDLGTTGKTSAIYYCECNLVDESTITWNTENDPVHETGISYVYEKVDGNKVLTQVNIATVDGFVKFNETMSDYKTGNVTVQILTDIDMTEKNWTPIYVTGQSGAGVMTIEGNDHKITNLSAPLFAGGFAGSSGIVIKDLTIADSTLEDEYKDEDGKYVYASTGFGAFICSVDSMPLITLENCHLVNTTITSGTGARVGGLIGWNSGYSNTNDGSVETVVTITRCSVEGCNITSKGAVGAIVGHAGASDWTCNTISDCVIKNCNLKSTDDGDWRVGVVVGTANVGKVTISDITESDNILHQTDKTAPAGQSDLYGRFVPGTTGKLTIDGVAIGSAGS